MALPAKTFSAIVKSMKSTGAMICTLPERDVLVLEVEAAHAAPVVAMRMGIDDRRDRPAFADLLLEQLRRGAHRFGQTSGSNTIQPVLPRTKVMSERSTPRT